jgi:hypothetical protein
VPRIILEFTGGFWDGQRFDSDSPDPDQWAWKLYRQFKDGTIGHTVSFASELYLEFMKGRTAEEVTAHFENSAGPQAHLYRVAERTEEGDTITVRIKQISAEEYNRRKR